MKTTVLGVRLNDYQREKLRGISGEGLEADLVRKLVDGLIEGKILIEDDKVVSVKKMKPCADKRKVKVQTLIDAIAEQLK